MPNRYQIFSPLFSHEISGNSSFSLTHLLQKSLCRQYLLRVNYKDTTAMFIDVVSVFTVNLEQVLANCAVNFLRDVFLEHFTS